MSRPVGPWADRQLRDEVLTLLIAGHETTANALTWIWYLVATRPDVEDRIHAELDSVLGRRLPTVKDLPALTYIDMVIAEALRLYPPAWAFSRRAINEDIICGYRIPARSRIMISPFVTHRHPDFWSDPEQFDPERFAPSRPAHRHPYAYFPFGGGPRQCIGNRFALTEMQLVVATIAQRYQVVLAPNQTIKPEALLNLRPNGPILMQAVPRTGGK